jgi:hypothetical protein
MKRFAIFAVGVAALSAIASGDVILTLNSGPVSNLPNFNWTYTATLKSGSSLNSGDFFTIYDIGGFGPGVPIANPVIMPSSNWNSSIQLLGLNGFSQTPSDSGLFYNVTFTFTGASPILAASDVTLGGGAGAFGYTSSANTSHIGAFSATSHATADGVTQGNTSIVTVAGTPSVPEPTTMFLSGGGLIVIGLLRRRRK